MKKIIAAILLIVSTATNAGGDSIAVKLISLIETGADEYQLEYQEADSTEIIKVDLEYNSLNYINLRILNFEKYKKSIKLLKEQLKINKQTRMGFFGGAPCLVDKKAKHYRSDALDVYDEFHSKDKERLVVYMFCEYK